MHSLLLRKVLSTKTACRSNHNQVAYIVVVVVVNNDV